MTAPGPVKQGESYSARGTQAARKRCSRAASRHDNHGNPRGAFVQGQTGRSLRQGPKPSGRSVIRSSGRVIRRPGIHRGHSPRERRVAALAARHAHLPYPLCAPPSPRESPRLAPRGRARPTSICASLVATAHPCELVLGLEVLRHPIAGRTWAMPSPIGLGKQEDAEKGSLGCEHVSRGDADSTFGPWLNSPLTLVFNTQASMDGHGGR